MQDIQITRRGALGGAVVAGVALFAQGVPGSSAVAVPTGRERARFLTDDELRVLAALVDRVVPGVPDDTVPGAVAARCHEGIDALLGAFTVSPPRIYAGGPFSDRAGARRNDFAEFLPLDRYERKAWRLRIEGSRGRKELERNGKVRGYQMTYRRGLAALEASVPGGFAAAPGPVRDLVLQQSDDPAVRRVVDLAVVHTLELMYGAPEYGGNHDLLGWRISDFEGDVQPRGWTDEEVTSPETSGPLDLVEDLVGDPAGLLAGLVSGAAPLAAMGSAESVHGLLARTHERHSLMRAELERLATPSADAAAALARLDEVAARVLAEATEQGR